MSEKYIASAKNRICYLKFHRRKYLICIRAHRIGPLSLRLHKFLYKILFIIKQIIEQKMLSDNRGREEEKKKLWKLLQKRRSAQSTYSFHCKRFQNASQIQYRKVMCCVAITHNNRSLINHILQTNDDDSLDVDISHQFISFSQSYHKIECALCLPNESILSNATLWSLWRKTFPAQVVCAIFCRKDHNRFPNGQGMPIFI